MKENQSFKSFKFASFETPTYQVISQESLALSQQKIKQGLNLCGICSNNECEIFGKQVIVSLGFNDKFVIAKEIRKALCVKCSKKLSKVYVVKIYMAKVKVEGRKIGGGETDQEDDSDDENKKKKANKVSFEYICEQKGKLMSFGSKDKQLVLWGYLHLQVKRLTKQLKCLNGHLLTQLGALYPCWVEYFYGGTKYADIFEGFEKVGRVEWSCDRCDRKLKGEDMSRSCRQCNYDICEQCSNK